MDTNHESRGHKPFQHVEMFATKSVTSPRQTRLMEFSPLQYTGKVSDKVGGLCRGHKSWKSATWYVSD